MVYQAVQIFWGVAFRVYKFVNFSGIPQHDVIMEPINPWQKSDNHYRYQRPRLTVKWEGGGNGCKTVLTNVVQVAEALDRPPGLLLKHLAIALGTRDRTELKRFLLNGHFSASLLEEKLECFISALVLCRQCSNPETVIKPCSKTVFKVVCSACGFARVIPDIQLSRYLRKMY